jgi:enamine deaminase RidA (YjgF/YER057c/UK114 family)
VRLLPPTLLVADQLTLQRGRRTIDVRFLGRANTRGDLVVHLPAERIAIVGDILVAPVPFSFGSYLGDWVGTLTRISDLPVDLIIPGHGPLQRDRQYLNRVRALLESTLSQVKQAVAEGKDLDATRRAVSLDSMRQQFTGGSGLLTRAFNEFFVAPAVERAWREVRGELQASGARYLNPPSLPPATGYTHVVVAPDGRTVYIAGQIALDSLGRLVGSGDFRAQANQVFANLGRALASVGGTFADLVKTTTFMTDATQVGVLRDVRLRYLDSRQPPANTMVPLAALARADLLIEIEAVALLRSPARP